MGQLETGAADPTAGSGGPVRVPDVSGDTAVTGNEMGKESGARDHDVGPEAPSPEMMTTRGLGDQDETSSIHSQNEDWRKAILNQFAEWLNDLADEDMAALHHEACHDSGDSPDLFTFYGELAALRHDIRLQAKAVQAASRNVESISDSLKRELHEGGRALTLSASELKGIIPSARDEAQIPLVVELISACEGVAQLVALTSSCILPRRPWLRKSSASLERIQQSQQMLFARLDDVLQRMGVRPLARIGMKFDPSIMRAVATSEHTGMAHGTVTRIARQGFQKGDHLLQLAEVEVEK